MQFTFNARKANRELADVLKGKLRSVTQDSKIHKALLEKYYTLAINFFPEDTGALKGTGSGYSRVKKYERIPHVTISSHHGIEIDPVEIQPNGSQKHYAVPALCMTFGVEKEELTQAINEAVENSAYWDDFIVYARRYITEAMYEH